jgi:uncharacterized GH25 family protein
LSDTIALFPFSSWSHTVRCITSLAFGLVLVAFAQAHALYITTAGEKVVVVFSDNLEPDTKVKEATWKKVGTPTLSARDAKGKVTEVKTEAGESCLKAMVPAHTAMLYGTVPYGVSAHGDKPKLLTYYPKAILDGGTGRDATIGKTAILEIVPEVEAGKVRFLVLAKGKPVAKAEVSVLVPEKGEPEKATTDDKGLTPAFDAKGRYGVTVRLTETKAGELKGEKYEEVGSTATLVVSVK